MKNEMHNIFSLLKGKIIYSFSFAFMAHFAAYFWINPVVETNLNVTDLNHSPFYESFTHLTSNHPWYYYLIVIYFWVFIGSVITFYLKCYLFKPSTTITTAEAFRKKYFKKILLIKAITTFIIYFSSLLLVIPGIIAYIKLWKVDFIFIDDPDQRIKEIIRLSAKSKIKNYIFKLFFHIPSIVIYLLSNLLILFLFKSHLLSWIMFNRYIIGLYNTGFLALPLLISHYIIIYKD